MSALVSAAADATETVGVGTMPQGTLSYATGSVIARTMKERAGIEARVQPSSGETVLIGLLASGAFDFGIANALEAAQASAGTGIFAGRRHENLRIAAVLYPLRVAFFVRRDSEIRSLADLAGKRVTMGFSAMGAVQQMALAVLANAGLAETAIRPVPVPNVVAGAERLLDDRADAFFFAVGAAKTSEVDAAVPIRALAMDPSEAAVARLHAVFADGSVVTAPPLPAFAGVAAPTPVLGFDNLLLTHAAVPDAIVTRVVESLARNKDVLVDGLALFRGLDPAGLYKEGLATPFHRATVRWASRR